MTNRFHGSEFVFTAGKNKNVNIKAGANEKLYIHSDYLKAAGADNELQYNENGFISGIKSFIYNGALFNITQPMIFGSKLTVKEEVDFYKPLNFNKSSYMNLVDGTHPDFQLNKISPWINVPAIIRNVNIVMFNDSYCYKLTKEPIYVIAEIPVSIDLNTGVIFGAYLMADETNDYSIKFECMNNITDVNTNVKSKEIKLHEAPYASLTSRIKPNDLLTFKISRTDNIPKDLYLVHCTVGLQICKFGHKKI
jgi:hypothetical protein